MIHLSRAQSVATIQPKEFSVPRSAQSNRQRAKARKMAQAQRRQPATTASVGPGEKVVKLVNNRDELLRLHTKGMTRREYRAGLAYRNWFSLAAVHGQVPISSMMSEVHAGSGSGLPPKIISELDAKRSLFWARWVVFRGEPDVIGAMDKVCGRCVPIGEITGGNSRIAGNIETALRIGLRQLATALEEQRAARTPQRETA